MKSPAVLCCIGLLLSDGAAAIHTNKHVGAQFGRSSHRIHHYSDGEEKHSPLFDVAINNRNYQPINCRGGECSDSTPALFAKVGLAAAVEGCLLYAVLNLASKANKLGYSNAVTTLIQIVEIFAVIFGSASFGAIVDNGLSAATKQVLDPNQIPVRIYLTMHFMCVLVCNFGI